MRCLWLVSLPLALLAACGRDEGSGEKRLGSVSTDTGQYTCVAVSADSARLALGGTGPYFSVYDISTSAVDVYPLPVYTDGYKTYDLMQVSPQAWLVAKQNNGVLYVSYGLDDQGRRTLTHVCRVTSPMKPLPDKGTRYSVYSLLDADTMLIIGSSNGLKYLTSADMARMATDTLVTARYASPLKHERVAKYQFAQEAMFITGDSLVTATDNGLYRVALSDFSNDNSYPTVVAHPMRCHDAAIGADSLYVLWSEDVATDRRYVTSYSLKDWGSHTRDADNSTTWIGLYGDSLRCFGTEGNFGCFRAAATVSDNFYFIRDGYLRKSDIISEMDESDERMDFSDNGYGLSSRMGLWRLDGDNPVFLGDVRGVAGVRGISVSDGTMYLAVSDGVYSVSVADRLLPGDRGAKLVEPVVHRAADRVESVCASGDTLVVGTRNGLHSLVLSTGEKREYLFQALRDNFESPYVRRIRRLPDGSYLLSTLNHANWRLGSITSAAPEPTDITFPPGEENRIMTLKRPDISWRTLGDNLFMAFVGIMSLIGLVVALMMLVKRRYGAVIGKLRKDIAEKIRTQRELETRQGELEEAVLLMRTELDTTKVKLDKQLSLPLQEVREAVDTHFPADAPSTPLKEQLRSLIAPVSSYLERPSDDETLAKVMPDIYMKLCRLVDEVTASALAMGQEVGNESVFSSCIKEYAAKLKELGVPSLLSVAGQIKWLKQATHYLEILKDDAGKELASKINEIVKDEECFTANQLQRLWATCLVGLATVSSRLNIARKGDLSDLDWQTRQRTWVVTTYTLLGIAKPEVENEKLRIDIPSIVGLRDARHHGSVYYYWMRQLSSYTFSNCGANFPANGADLLWMIRLSKDPAMRDGIMMAYHYDRDEELPGHLSSLIEGRPRGRRPKNPHQG